MNLKCRTSERILLPLSTGLWGNRPEDTGQRLAWPTGPMASAHSCWHPECRQPQGAWGAESTREQASELGSLDCRPEGVWAPRRATETLAQNVVGPQGPERRGLHHTHHTERTEARPYQQQVPRFALATTLSRTGGHAGLK